MEEIRNCLSCNSTEYSLIWKLPSVEESLFRLHALDWNVPDSLRNTEFSVVQCRDCRLVFATPQPSLDGLKEYYARYSDGSILWTEEERKFNSLIASELAKHKTAGKILDVGCGYGLFLHEMQKKGFECLGVEQVLSSEEYIREHFAFDLFAGNIEEFFDQSTERFDIISFLNVLEHVKNPKTVLHESYCRLNKEGLIVVVIPNAQLQLLLGKIRKCFGSVDPYFQKQGRHMVAISPPHHLTSFTPGTLQNMLQSTGFETVRLVSAPVVPNTGHPLRSLLKYVVYFSGRVVDIITLGLGHFSYSTLCIARKA